MTRTDAFLFAIKKTLERQREYIDRHEVKSIQLVISLNRNGEASVTLSPRTEDTVVGCYEGHARVTRHEFNT
jgi:hypothetical protein